MKRTALIVTAATLAGAFTWQAHAGWPHYQIEPPGVLSLEMDLDVHENPLLYKLTLTIHGLPEGHPTLGIGNTEANPFRIFTYSHDMEFYNLGGLGSSHPLALHPLLGDAHGLDSGFIGPGYSILTSAWGLPPSNMSSWAMTGESIEEFTGPGEWIAEEPVPAPAEGLPILRATWDPFFFAEGTFLLRLAEPLQGHTEFCVRWSTYPHFDYCDIDYDHVMGVSDLLIMLEQWGQCELCDTCRADLDGDRTVGVPDLLILLEQWGLEYCEPKE